jgi:hypothetical protein
MVKNGLYNNITIEKKIKEAELKPIKIYIEKGVYETIANVCHFIIIYSK